MNNTSFVIGTLMLFLSLTLEAIGQPLTLEQAITIALQKNETIQQYQEKLAQKEKANYEAWGNFLPQVKLEASYNHINEPLSINLDFLREGLLQMQTSDQVKMANLQSLIVNGRPLTEAELALVQQQAYTTLNAALPPFSLGFKNQDFRTATLTAVQPLFLGGKLIAAKRFASAELQAGKQELLQTQQQIIRQVVNQYLAVALLQQIVKTRNDVLQGMLKHQRQAQKLFKQGLIARTDLLRARVAVAEARRNLFDDQNKLALAQIALIHTLGLPEETAATSLQIADSLRYHPFNDSLETLQRAALRNQPLLKLVQAKEKAAAQQYVAERAEFLPQIAAFGKYEMYPEYLSVLEPRWVVGVKLEMNVFNGFKKYQRVQKAKHLRKEVSFLHRRVQRQVKLWLQKSYRQMRNAETRYQQLAADIALARENLRLQQKRFQTGLGTSLDVIDARLVLEKELIARHQSLYDYYRSLIDLLTAVGEPQRFNEIW